jgi:hypothetical protein
MNSHNEYKAIVELDLDPIKVKLMHEESGEGWTLQQANAVEFEYRRFLHLMKMFPNEQTAPLADVDTFWHYHILDTLKYAQDCDAVFGYFLHHFPYIGLRGEADLLAHHRVGERMRELYEQTFGEAYVRQADGSDTGVAPATEAAKTAFSCPVAKTAFSSRVATTAFSSRVATTAFSSRVATTAFSSRVATTAFSVPVAKTAFSSRVVKSPTAATASSRAAEKTVSSREAANSFYTQRPALVAA